MATSAVSAVGRPQKFAGREAWSCTPHARVRRRPGTKEEIVAAILKAFARFKPRNFQGEQRTARFETKAKGARTCSPVGNKRACSAHSS
jgi:hypothetical protein